MGPSTPKPSLAPRPGHHNQGSTLGHLPPTPLTTDSPTNFDLSLFPRNQESQIKNLVESAASAQGRLKVEVHVEIPEKSPDTKLLSCRPQAHRNSIDHSGIPQEFRHALWL